MSIPVKGRKEIEQVATVASNYDTEIGKIIADAMEKVGKDGVITVEEGKSLQTDAKWIEGLQFDKGYLSPYFITNPNSMQCVLEDAYILIHEKKITTAQGADSNTRKGFSDREASIDHCRRNRRRGADPSGCE